MVRLVKSVGSRIGQPFDAIVIGASKKGSWVRILFMAVEGSLMQGFKDVDVGDRIRVQPFSTNVKRGFIDFKRVGISKNSNQ